MLETGSQDSENLTAGRCTGIEYAVNIRGQESIGDGVNGIMKTEYVSVQVQNIGCHCCYEVYNCLCPDFRAPMDRHPFVDGRPRSVRVFVIIQLLIILYGCFSCFNEGR